jgi:hypothetical protein
MDLHPLLEMLATNAGPNGTALLGALRSNSNGNQSPTMQELLAQIGSSNPTASLIIKYLADQRAKEQSEEQPIRDVTPELVQESSQDVRLQDNDLGHLEDSSAALSELREQVESLFAELKQVRERNDALACALGACCLCWGDDSECRVCRGRGRPGFSIPEPGRFEEYVLPAIRMLQTRKRNGKEFPAGAPSHAANSAERLNEN